MIRHLIPVGIQDEIRLKNRLRRQWQITNDPALKVAVNRLQRSVTRQLNEYRNDQWSATPESLIPEQQSLWKMAKRVMKFSTSSPPLITQGVIATLGLKKAEALADSLEAQFQPVNDSSEPAFIENVEEAMRVYFFTPASEL
jgi:thiaminase